MKFFSRDRTLYISFFTMTLTIALQNLIVFGVNLGDNIMIGAYSQTAMAGIALVNQIQFFLNMVIIGVGEGVVIISSRAWGQKDILSIKKAASVGMRIGILAVAALWVVMFFFPAQVLGLLTNEKAVIAEGVKYSKIICFSYIFYAMTSLLIATMRSVETVKIGFYTSIVTFFIDTILNFLFIYGIWIFPEMGGRGAAMTTVISRAIEFTLTVLYVRFREKKLELRLRDYMLFDVEVLLKYIKVSLPLIASQALWGIAQATQTGILGRLGESAIAANSISITVFQIISVVIYGAASATSVIIGKTLGGGKRELIKEYVRSLQVIYLGLGLLTGGAMFVFKDFIIQIYKITPETHTLAFQFMTVLSVTVVGTAYQMTCLTGIARGGGDTKIILINDTLHMWLIIIPAAALSAFVFHFSPVVVFACLKCDQILKCIVAAWWTNSYRWIKKI